MKRALLTTVIALMLTSAFAQDTPEAKEAPPRIKLIEIHVFPNDVIVIKASMIRMKELRDHLAKLVPDAHKPAVEVTVIPKTEKQMPEVAHIIAVAKELGFRKVGYRSPGKTRTIYTEIHILVSKSGLLLVGKDEIKEKDLTAHLKKLVPDETRRKDVRIIVNASRLVKMKRVTAVTRACRELGFRKVRLKVIPE